ncbi:hypothetical protein LPJ81_000970, partial [Coemansia sp. IMI 209127]
MTLEMTIAGCLVYALVDSGAEGNFMQAELAESLGATFEELEKPTRNRGANGEEIGMVTEVTRLLVRLSNKICITMRFIVTPISAPAIIGLPWIHQQKGRIDTDSWSLHLAFGKLETQLPCGHGFPENDDDESCDNIILATLDELDVWDRNGEISDVMMVNLSEGGIYINETNSTAQTMEAEMGEILEHWGDVFAEPQD